MTLDERMSARAYLEMLGLATTPAAAAPPRQRTYTEAELQRSCVELARFILADEAILFHVPNERAEPVTRKLLAGMGVVPGVADLVIVAPVRETTPRALAFFIELKTPERRENLSDAQRDFEARCVAIGAPHRVVCTLEEFRQVLEDWGLCR